MPSSCGPSGTWRHTSLTWRGEAGSRGEQLGDRGTRGREAEGGTRSRSEREGQGQGATGTRRGREEGRGREGDGEKWHGDLRAGGTLCCNVDLSSDKITLFKGKANTQTATIQYCCTKACLQWAFLLSFPFLSFQCLLLCLCLCCCCAVLCSHLGAGGNRGTAVDVDYGGVSFEVTQLDGVLEL